MTKPSRAYHRFAIVVSAMTVLLVWWGAAVTTKQAGMAFADWPLSSGSINPDGWLKILPYFLEHGHRLIASAVGMLTLALFAWSHLSAAGDGKKGGRASSILELLLLVFWLGLLVYLMTRAGAERESFAIKARWWWAAGSCGAVLIAWLVWSWNWRGWSLLTRLSALALVAVTAQAILGGLRVTEVSDLKAVLHACLAHAFFCLLLLIVTVSNMSSKPSSGRLSGPLRILPALLSGAVFVQLILGALMRHFHRNGLADTGIIRTQGELIPAFDSPIITVMFLHKYWAVGILIVALVAAFVAHRALSPGHVVRRRLALTAVLVLGQLLLGIAVIATGKSFWITNFHVVNGLAILGLSFLAAAASLDRRTGAGTGADGLPRAATEKPKGPVRDALPAGQP